MLLSPLNKCGAPERSTRSKICKISHRKFRKMEFVYLICRNVVNAAPGESYKIILLLTKRAGEFGIFVAEVAEVTR